VKSISSLAHGHAPRVHAVLSMLVVAATLLFVPAAYAASDTYMFRDTLASVEGSGNTLVATFNNGPFVNGTFTDTTIDANVCPGTPTVRGWSFPRYGGLRTPNNAPAVVGGSYTISMIVKFNPMGSGYARLIDFSNSTLDTGIYELNGGVSFYPVGEFASGSFVNNRFSFVTITRDAATKVVSLFIGTTPAGTYTDTGNLYVPLAQNVIFLMDNTTGSANISESAPGVITYIKLIDTPVTSAQISALQAEACNTVVAPTVTGVVPSSGPTAGGTPVTITGTKFTGATAVKFGGNDAASFTVDSDTQIRATSPAGVASVVDVTVTTANGTSASSANDKFTYAAAASTYTVGGSVTGLAAGDTLVLKNNGGNDLNVTANGVFAFTTPLTTGAAYAVTVGSAPIGKACTVTNGSGTVQDANVTNVGLACAEVAPAQTQPVPTLSDWTLILLSSVLGLGAVWTLRRRRV
jgi:hypothetical protein